jgi:ParB family chromosome partitioning protein
VQTELRRGAISAGHARALLTHPDPARATLAVIAQGLNVRQTEALTARMSGTDTAARQRETRVKDADIQALEHDLRQRLGLGASINPRGHGGTLQLVYKTPDQLEGLIALLLRS